MANFRETLNLLIREEDAHVIDTPEDWAQGRTLYGGMTAALCYRAIAGDFPDLPPLRSAQFILIGPATGRLHFRTALLRRGRSATVVGVDCHNEDGLAARAHLVFGQPRESVIVHERVAPPEVPAPEDCGPLHRTSKPLPGFLNRFEYRLASAGGLFQSDAAPDLAVWVRFRDPPGDDPVTALLALADALPAAAMVNFPRPAPVSTMTWTLDLHGPLPPIDGWHLVCSSSESAADGYSLQPMRVFDREGRALASGRQMVAVFA